jgi:pyruvate-ferredoxin/flavodoxin oxidoreductase
MATRATGFAMLASASVQEAGDMAPIAHAAALESRVPFLHFLRRLSHVARGAKVQAHRRRRPARARRRAHGARTPGPRLVAGATGGRGTAQNPDVYFQAREAANPRLLPLCRRRARGHASLRTLTGRAYGLVEYAGAPDATRVVILMGSGAETAEETARRAECGGARVGVVKVRLYRPFPAAALLASLPPTTRAVAVLDRTKEPGSAGEPSTSTSSPH